MQKLPGEPIGGGWQFNAYRVGDRVCKIATTDADIARRLKRSRWQLRFRPSELQAEVKRVVEERAAVLEEFRSRRYPSTVLANLAFEGDRIWQEYAITLGQLIRRDPSNATTLIDLYVESTANAWRTGVAETTFNFTVNHGFSRQGQVVILDIGEVTFHKSYIRQHVEERFWRKSWTITSDLPADASEYAVQKMDTELTVARLEQLWVDTPFRS